MDSSFVEFLNSQTKKFKQAIMRDYWDYRRTPVNKTGFFVWKQPLQNIYYRNSLKNA